jgi:tRNA(adenine34) deaminase
MTAPTFMDLALKAAETAGKSAEVPIGCVIVLNNEVIATAANRTLTDRDPTAHAEILAIRQATAAVGSERLVDCDLYVTLEPCTMCAGAIVLSRVSALVFGAWDPKAGAVGSLWDVVRDRRLNHRPEVVAGVLAADCAELLHAFFQSRRGADPLP